MAGKSFLDLLHMAIRIRGVKGTLRQGLDVCLAQAFVERQKRKPS